MQILATNQLGSRKFWPQPIYFIMTIFSIKYQPIRLIWQPKLEFVKCLENMAIGSQRLIWSFPSLIWLSGKLHCCSRFWLKCLLQFVCSQSMVGPMVMFDVAPPSNSLIGGVNEPSYKCAQQQLFSKFSIPAPLRMEPLLARRHPAHHCRSACSPP
jgi:hypothetical protein